MLSQATQSLIQYVRKKGIAYFLTEPSKEDVAGFKGFLFDDNGKPILKNLYSFAGIAKEYSTKDIYI